MLKKKIKKFALTGLTIALVASSAIGVSAAVASQHMRSKGVWNYKNEVIIDGDAVGFWLTEDTKIESADGVNAPFKIAEDDDINEDSIITVFYSNDTKDLVGKAGAEYTQSGHSVFVKFKSKPLKAGSTTEYEEIKIDAIHVVNPINAPATNS